ncbi:MAG: SDR family NAD(P)-dependent oxidoreductase [Bordetella sp.]
MQSFEHPFKALVLGCSGTIGSAFVEAFQKNPACSQVVGIGRSTHEGFALEDEASIARAAMQEKGNGPFSVIVDATGVLTIDGQGPEKRLAALNAHQLARAFQVNAIGRALILKHFIDLLPRQGRCLFAVLSARVGSLSDNKLGGWYGYRASKAAGNMFLQTAAIESHRTRPEAIFAALQPGTVPSKLSAPFQSGHATVAAEDSAAGLLKALDALEPRAQAWFIDYQGNAIDW